MDGAFSLVFCVFNGISNVLTQERQTAVFENAARHLARGGCSEEPFTAESSDHVSVYRLA